MNNRLHQFLTAEGMTQAQFAESINVAPAGVSHVLAGRNKPGYDFLYSMMLHYPDLNIEWLLTGRGRMYKGQEREKETSEPDLFSAVQPDVQEVPKAPLSPAPAQVSPVPAPAPSVPASAPKAAPTVSNGQRSASKVIVFYDDGTFQEM